MKETLGKGPVGTSGFIGGFWNSGLFEALVKQRKAVRKNGINVNPNYKKTFYPFFNGKGPRGIIFRIKNENERTLLEVSDVKDVLKAIENYEFEDDF